jgi:MerR family transcriptional regulator, thiopeptide resistance regulator
MPMYRAGAESITSPSQSQAPMKTYSISKLAQAFGLSRSTLLYYDRIGLLPPSGRTGSGYRYYSEKDHRQLDRICHFREAGLTLKDIHGVLSSGGKPGVKLLDKRMRENMANIVDLKNQQRVLAGMLSRIASGNSPAPVDRELWVEMLQAAGMNQKARKRWHTEFERRAPEAHNEFLLSLGIPQEEVAKIRRWSRGEIPSYWK